MLDESQTTRRTPLILVILILPFQVIELVLYLVGTIIYLPIYIYFLAFSKFLFSQTFDTNQIFYLIFCIPRALCSLVGFLIAAAELYGGYWLFGRFVSITPEIAYIITALSILAFAIFSFRFGYKFLNKTMKLPKLKSVPSHLRIILYGIEDMLSAIFTLATLILIFRAKMLFCYKLSENERKYFAFSLRAVILSLYDAVCLFFWLILLVTQWRFYHTRRIYTKTLSEEKKHAYVIYQALNVLVDLIFIPMFLLVVINPFIKAGRLLTHMNRLPVTTWRRLIFDEFIGTVYDVVPIGCLVLSLPLIYQIPLCCVLWTHTVKSIKTVQFNEAEQRLLSPEQMEEQGAVNFDEAEQASLSSEEGVDHDELGRMIDIKNKESDAIYRSLYYNLFLIVVLDILLIVSYILLVVSVYRYLILRIKIKQERNRIDEQQEANPTENKLSLTYREHRILIYDIFSMKISSEDNFLNCYHYHFTVVDQGFRFMIDVPVIILSCPLLIAPWRLSNVLQEIKIKWNKLNNIQVPDRNVNVRCYSISEAFKVFIDYIHIVLFGFCLLAFWRWNFMFPGLRAIIAREERAVRGSKTRFGAFDLFTINLTFGIIFDVVFFLVFLLLVPFLIVCPWRLSLLVRTLAKTNKDEFSRHRSIVCNIGFISLCDFLDLFPLLLTVFTLFRIPTLYDFTQIHKKKNTEEALPSKEGDDEENVENPSPALDEAHRSHESLLNPLEDEGVSAEETIAREQHILLFEAGRKAGLLVILDILSLPLSIFVFTSYALYGQYKLKIAEYEGEKSLARTIGSSFYYRKRIIFARCVFGLGALASHIVTIFLTILLCSLLWRLPTFFILLWRKDLNDALLLDLIPDSERRQKIKKGFLTKFGVMIPFCFKELLYDLLSVPVFLILILITPWRSWPVLRQIYRYDASKRLKDQMSAQRILIDLQVGKGLHDIWTFIELVIVLVTIIRIPFLWVIIVKNRFPNSKIAIKYSRPSIKKKDDPELQDNLQKPRETKLSLRKCISITFRELMRDLFYIPFGLVILVIAPWRVFTVCSIIFSQVDRIPTHDVNAKKVGIPSRREELLSLWLEFLRVDIPGLFKVIIMIVTIYKIPTLLFLFGRYLLNIRKFLRKELSFSKELDVEYREGTNAVLKFLFSLIIIALFFRIKSTLTRLTIYRKSQDTKEKESRYKQHHHDEATDEERLSLNEINWDTYGKVCQFLEVKDLARLSQASKKFNTLNQKDFYWEYQYKRDYADRRGLAGDVTYKERCVNVYQQDKVYSQKQSLTQEQRDSLYGPFYILFEEAVKSLQRFCQVLLLPFKLVGAILWFVFKRCTSGPRFLTGVTLVTKSFVDIGTKVVRGAEEFRSFPQLDSELAYNHAQQVFVNWILFFVLQYICRVGFLISSFSWFTIRLTSSGENHVCNIQESANTTRIIVEYVRRDNQLGDPIPYGNRFVCYIFHVLQFIVACLHLAIWGTALAVLPYISYQYFNWSWYEALLGPCWIFLVHYCAVLSAILSYFWYMIDAAPFFRPDRAISEIFVLLGYILLKLFQFIVRPLFDILATGIKFICSSLYKGLVWLCKGVKHVFAHLFKGLRFVVLGIISLYTGILVSVTKFSLTRGLFGDAILTVVALIWMLWPLIIPIFLTNKIYFVPCGVVSLLLVFVGYKKIHSVSREAEVLAN